MKKSTLTLLAMVLLVWQSALSQSETTLQDQFTDVIEKSNRYEDYKVVKIFKLNNLRKNVNDTLAGLRSELTTAQDSIQNQQSSINTLTGEVSNLQLQLADSQKKENGIQFFGALLKKSTYKSMMWGIIGLLLLLLVIVFLRFKRSNTITKAANLKLLETEEEFEKHRQRTLEREQQLRRKLQDEINKNKV